MANTNGNGQPVEKWWIVIFRHFTTIVAILAAFWWLAVPRIEGFINNAVNDRLTRVETALDTQSQQLTTLLERLAAVQYTQRKLEEDRLERLRVEQEQNNDRVPPGGEPQ